LEGKNADGAGLVEEEDEGRERNWGEREVEKRVAAMGETGREDWVDGVLGIRVGVGGEWRS
jgi:hypothetical protein